MHPSHLHRRQVNLHVGVILLRRGDCLQYQQMVSIRPATTRYPLSQRAHLAPPPSQQAHAT